MSVNPAPPSSHGNLDEQISQLMQCKPLSEQKLADTFSLQLRNLAFDALDKSICAVLGSDQFQANQTSEKQSTNSHLKLNDAELGSFEWKLYYSWPSILDLLRNVAAATDKDLVSLGVQLVHDTYLPGSIKLR
ncbi:hypothetical protein J5N97_012269 [Dioscorea zingiberensis]|uniref:Uncharacterized protein n=1 Tax=Dioscorea zingiberensis TaxID=325984 RepID=A0A9D5CR51_9LILI|nr:hypothetical protein J5N97_012269 [Dioscorea zingiberensis]